MRKVDPARFPNVVEALQENGLDPTTELIPVSPAAHYMMGGVVTDLDARSTVPGLLAVGETACTGLHGANRLASNSLSECFVFGARAAAAALDEPPVPADAPAPTIAEPLVTPSAETREALWRDAGLVRDADGPASPARRPEPPRTAHRDVRAAARGEPRSPRQIGLPGPGSRRSTGATRSSAPTIDPILAHLGLTGDRSFCAGSAHKTCAVAPRHPLP